MQKFDWEAGEKAVQNSLDQIEKLKSKDSDIPIGFWDKKVGCLNKNVI